MTKSEELQVFIDRADELINSKYILADVKIVNLLKAIAASDTLIALFKNCLADFDYTSAKKKYLVKNPYLSDEKGQFVLPPNSRELLAFVFNVLMDIDAKRISLCDFLDKYFYENGSSYAGYSAFVNAMIKPFKNSVTILMEKVIEGKLQDPVEAVTEEEEKRARQKELDEIASEKEKELSKKAYGDSIKKIKALLLANKKKIKDCKLDADVKKEIILVIDMLANVVESEDKDAIEYAFIAYKYVAKAYPFKFLGKVKAINKALKDIVNEL